MLVRKQIVLCLTVCAALPAGSQAQTTHRWVDRDGRVTYSDQPPPPRVLRAEEMKLGTPNSIAASGPDYATRRASQDSPVTLYSGGDCGAECALARDFLKQTGVPYREKTIKTAEDAAAFRSATGSEELSVPTLLVGTAAHKGYEDGAWRKLLTAAGYPLAGARPAPR